MPLKKSRGNMYVWTSHTHASLGGMCPHECKYCYVNHPTHGRPPKYQGPPRLIEKEMNVRFGEGKSIFIENCNDMFADDIPQELVRRIIEHCMQYPKNRYVFQTKNPAGAIPYLIWLPQSSFFGVTIETNRDTSQISKAPTPLERFEALGTIKMLRPDLTTFITIEPILDFDEEILLEKIGKIKPGFVNIGADSKGHGLPEPTSEKVWALIGKLQDMGVEIREKSNLERLKKKS